MTLSQNQTTPCCGTSKLVKGKADPNQLYCEDCNEHFAPQTTTAVKNVKSKHSK